MDFVDARVAHISIDTSIACWFDAIALYYTLMKMAFEKTVGARSLLTLARAFLQLLQALGVTESGTFLFLAVVPEEAPRLD